MISRNENSNSTFDVAADAIDIKRGDISVRTQALVTETGGTAGVVVRTQDLEDTLGYVAGVSYLPELGGSIALAGIGHTGNMQTFFNAVSGPRALPLPYDVREVLSEIQIDVFGNEVRVWAWRAGDAMPSEPQFVVTDDTYSEPGHVRLVVANRGSTQGTGNSAAIFRQVHVADMPIHELIGRGDFDANGVLDATDIDILNEQIKLGGNDPSFDLNGDTLVNDEDRHVWVRELAGTTLGDANLDFTVDATDLNALALNWQQSLASWARGDFTGDGMVNSADLNVLALNWRYAANAPIPEPSSIGLVLLSLVFLTGRYPRP